MLDSKLNAFNSFQYSGQWKTVRSVMGRSPMSLRFICGLPRLPSSPRSPGEGAATSFLHSKNTPVHYKMCNKGCTDLRAMDSHFTSSQLTLAIDGNDYFVHWQRWHPINSCFDAMIVVATLILRAVKWITMVVDPNLSHCYSINNTYYHNTPCYILFWCFNIMAF